MIHFDSDGKNQSEIPITQDHYQIGDCYLFLQETDNGSWDYKSMKGVKR